VLKAEEGNILNNGIDVSKNEKWKTFTGSYLDRNFLIDYLKPEEFFTFVGLVYGMSDALVSERLAQFKSFFNEEILGTKKYIRKLSEGNIQKVGIAAALLPDPKVVILDEPFANLDPTSQNHLKKILEQHCKDKKTTIILSSHNLNHVVDICTHIVLIEKGKIIKNVIDVQSQSANVMRDLSEYFES
jgi:ABC-2 type transport system ATP-binding protein